MKRVLKRISLKRVVLVLLLLLVPLSSVVTVAAIADFARGRAWERHYTYERWRTQRALAQQLPLAASALAQAQPEPPPAPDIPTRRGGRVQPGSPAPEQPETTVVTTPDGRTVVLNRQRPDEPFEVGSPDQFDADLYFRSRNAFRLGQDLTVGPDETVRDAAVVFGNATIAGHVTGNLVVIFGTANIASTAVIDGDFVTIGSGAKVQPGASAQRDVVVVGGPLDAPAGFGTGGGQIVIGSGWLGNWLDDVVPYLSRGLAWGRVIVPDLPWVWAVLSLIFLLYAALNLVFDRPVLACANTLRTRPLTTFGSGLLVLLLIGPVCVLLAISIIGIAVVPFVICALIAAGIIGKVAVARWIGMSAVPEDPDGSRAHAARSFVIGFAVLVIIYMIPIIGIISWAIAGVLGLGSAALAFMAAYRRENPTRPSVVVPPSPPPPAYPPYPAEPLPGSTSAAFDASASTPMMPPPFEAPPPPPTPAAVYAGVQSVAASGLLVAQPRALFRDRLASFVVDILLVFVVVAFLDSVGIVDSPAAFFPLLLIYLIGSWTWKQTSLGGVVCQIRLVKTDGMPLNFADALVRGLAGIFSLAVLAIGALWILRDPERQAWHDKIAGTYVVKVPRNWPL
jgi:uncharacterized RDD family membrane protein YckC